MSKVGSVRVHYFNPFAADSLHEGVERVASKDTHNAVIHYEDGTEESLYGVAMIEEVTTSVGVEQND